MAHALGLLATLVVGLVIWRYQLIGKRRTELAEEALLTFAHAVDALAFIRAPMSLTSEHEALRKELGAPVDQKVPGEDYQITLWRMHKHHDRFAELRRLQLLCKYHFGEAAYEAFEKFNRARHCVWAAARVGATTPENNVPPTPEAIKRQQEREAAIWAGAYEQDQIADAVDAAQRDLEAILTPQLRADAALIPIAVRWWASKARSATLFRRDNPTATANAPDGPV